MISNEQASSAVVRMSVLKFFPADDYVRLEIARVLLRMVSCTADLEFLVREMIDKVREWPGPYEMRAIFCTKRRPADGVEAWSSISGYTPDDLEMAQIESRGDHHVQLPAVKAPLQLEGDVIDVTPAIKQIAPQRTTFAQALRHQDSAARLASIAGVAIAPIRCAGTHKRTPEENERIARDTMAQVEARQKQRAAQ